MKKFILFLAFATFVTIFSFANDKRDNSLKPAFIDLVELEEREIKKYEGYRFDVVWIDHSPLINITFEQIDAVEKKTKALNLIAVIDPKKSVLDEAKTLARLTSLKSFKPKDVVESGFEKDGDNKLFRFNGIDSKGQIQFSEWRNATNGFAVKNVIFDKHGQKPINMTFFYKLKINSPFSRIDPSNKSIDLTLREALRKYGEIDVDDIDDVIRLCVRIVNTKK